MEKKRVAEYFTNSKILREKLDSLRPIPAYACMFNVIVSLSRQSTIIVNFNIWCVFLKGIGKVFGTIKMRILLMEPLPTSTECFLVIYNEKDI